MSDLRVREEDGALVFEVHVAPRSSRNRIVGVRDGAIKVALTAPPVDGAANDALRKLLAKKLGIATSDVEIVAGERSRKKVLRVRGVHVASLDLG